MRTDMTPKPEGNANGPPRERDGEWLPGAGRISTRRSLQDKEIGHAPSTSRGRANARLGAATHARGRGPTVGLPAAGGLAAPRRDVPGEQRGRNRAHPK